MSDPADIEYEIVGTAQERMNRRKVRASERYWEREYREVLSRLKEAEAELAEWQRHGVKVTEDCERCNGGWAGGDKPDPDCPICGGTGKKPRDGVLHFDVGTGLMVAFSAEWLEADDGR